MAMNGTQLGTDMSAAARAKFITIDPTVPVTDVEVDAIWKAIGPKIIDHITANAVIKVTITSGSSAGTAFGTIA